MAWFAVAWYGLHPAIAETVNYINQRADLMATCGVVAAMLIYVRFPSWRKYGLYLAPLIVQLLSKVSAVVFPGLALAYVILFEGGVSRRAIRSALGLVPAAALCAAAILLEFRLVPHVYIGAAPAYEYRITQPYVLFRYFSSSSCHYT